VFGHPGRLGPVTDAGGTSRSAVANTFGASAEGPAEARAHSGSDTQGAAPGGGRRSPRRSTVRWPDRRNPAEKLENDMAESYTGNAYCVKCKEKRDFTGEVKISESGRRMAQGICSVCGTKLNRILGKA
jgi:hypothetical protein